MSRDRLMRYALWLASCGMKVFPLMPGSKVPAVARDWEGAATSDIERIERWWLRDPYNVAIATGPSGLLVIDCDVAKDQRGDRRHGRDVLETLAKEAGASVPRDTLTVATAGGGSHLYFRRPEGVRLTNTAGRLGAHVDTRAMGGYVVAPGSVVAGRRYRVLRSVAPAVAPAWLVALLTPPVVRPPIVPAQRGHASSSYVDAAVAGEIRNVEGSRVGERNRTLFVAAARLGRFVGSGSLSAETVRSALLTAAQRHVDVDGFSLREAQRTVESGLRRGTTAPAGASGAGRRFVPGREQQVRR